MSNAASTRRASRSIGPGDVTDDDLLPQAWATPYSAPSPRVHYSAAHPSPTNKDFVAAFKKAYNFRPELHGGGRL